MDVQLTGYQLSFDFVCIFCIKCKVSWINIQHKTEILRLLLLLNLLGQVILLFLCQLMNIFNLFQILENKPVEIKRSKHRKV